MVVSINIPNKLAALMKAEQVYSTDRFEKKVTLDNLIIRKLEESYENNPFTQFLIEELNGKSNRSTKKST